MHLDRSNKTRSPHSTNAAASTRPIHAHISRDSIVSDASSTSVHRNTNFMYLSHAHSFNARFSGFPATSCRARVWLESGSSGVRASTRGVRALLDDHHRSQARTHSAYTAYTYHDAMRCSPSSAECRACAACHACLCVFIYIYGHVFQWTPPADRSAEAGAKTRSFSFQYLLLLQNVLYVYIYTEKLVMFSSIA